MQHTPRFDAAPGKPVGTAEPISGAEIRQVREQARLSQAVFARCLACDHGLCLATGARHEAADRRCSGVAQHHSPEGHRGHFVVASVLVRSVVTAGAGYVVSPASRCELLAQPRVRDKRVLGNRMAPIAAQGIATRVARSQGVRFSPLLAAIPRDSNTDSAAIAAAERRILTAHAV